MNAQATYPNTALGPHAGERHFVQALRAGDEVAFEALIERDHASMKRLARTFVDSDAVAEEVTQETWVAVLNGIHAFEGRSALRTWIFSILTNRAKTYAIRERRTLPFSAAAEADGFASVDPEEFVRDGEEWAGHWAIPPRPWQRPERRVLSLEIREQLRRALGELPERQRVVVTLRDVEGFTAEEVRGLLDLSVENQRVLLHRGRARLRACLDPDLGDSGAAWEA
ncbi:MAG TPA: sigma-70 family RNA polymerase sigma factor [Solirubrobacteraceae bacterium]|nr:sigma-70 family RNA polymerase sigma factor [Solirubrobacteraceae bacterium]